MRKIDSKDELSRLKREIDELNEQMQRLVRTEKRLSVSRQLLDDQVKRMEALNRFALRASRAESLPKMLDNGLQLAFAVLPLEQGIAYVNEGKSVFAPAAIRSLPGREHRDLRIGPRIALKGPLPKVPKLGRGDDLRDGCATLQPLFESFEMFFPSDGEEDSANALTVLLPVYLSDSEEPLVLLLLRRISREFSFLDHIPGPDDLPFLNLFSVHLASAAQNLMLFQRVRASEQVAHLKAAENERLYQQAHEAVRGRDEFLSLASHELRTPITPLKNELELLSFLLDKDKLCSYPRDRLKRLVQVGNRELVRLSKLIDGMLEVTRITSGRLSLHFESVGLGALVREMIERFRIEIANTGSEVILDLRDSDAGFWDRLRIEQVVTNLLTNALKYGRGRPIHISSRTDGEKAVLSVHDRGIGIAPKDQAKIFQRFARAVPESEAGGLGLGLYLTRQIVEAHHGVITVRSSPEEGTVFTVELPLKAEANIQSAAA